MNSKHDFGLNDEFHGYDSSSKSNFNSCSPIEQKNDNSESQTNSLSNSKGNDNQHPVSLNYDQITKTKIRSNSKVVRANKLPQQQNIKLHSFNTSISLPPENDLLGSQAFYSEFESNKLDLCSDFDNENTAFNTTNQELNQNALNNSQFPDSNCHKKWKKILSKMFFYDNKNSNSKTSSGESFESTDTSNSPKELYVLMNKKETKKLMKMKSDSKYHKCNTLSVLACTKGNIVKKFKNSVFQGVPDSLRGTLWQTIIDPFHSFCIKLNPEIASLMNSYDFNKINSNESNNPIINMQNEQTERGFEDEDIDENENESFNSTSSCLSYTNLNSNISQNPNPNLNRNDDCNSHSIEYVKINLNTNRNLIQFLSSRALKNIVNSIEGDISRTLIQFKKMQNPNTQNSLKRILSAYSVIDGGLGYSQGMAFIAAMLLLYMDEHSSFNCFCNLMLSKRFGFRNLFINGFPRVILMNKVWNVALQNNFPHLHRKLAQFNIDPIVYTLGWWLACFLNFPLPNDVLLLLFDRSLLFGSSSLISFGLTIFGVCHEYLEKSTIDEMIALLQMPSNCPKMLDSKEVISHWNNNFWISKKSYAKLLKKANVSYLP